jgi:hypothetical protein
VLAGNLGSFRKARETVHWATPAALAKSRVVGESDVFMNLMHYGVIALDAIFLYFHIKKTNYLSIVIREVRDKNKQKGYKKMNIKAIKNICAAFTLLSVMGVPSQAQLIVAPISATATSFYDDGTNIQSPSLAINGSGISDPTVIQTGDIIPSLYPTHDQGNGMWHTNFVVQASITFDLGAAYTLTGFHLWNANQNPGGANNLSNRGIQTANIFVSADNVSFTQITGPATFTQAPGANGYTGESYTISALGTQFVRFDVLTNWGSPNSITGISEIRFEAVPEPSTYAMLLLGVGAMVVLRRMRREA